MHRPLSATVVIPTRNRSSYLDVALASVVPQAHRASAEVIVVSDGPDAATAAVAERHGVRWVALPAPQGVNAARNVAVERTTADLLVFIDDDIAAPSGWLDALLEGVDACPEHDVFGGPIRARLEGGPRACGREPAPITTLDEGPVDRDVPLVWGANMAIRRRALDRIGPFDASIVVRGDEEDWQRRYAATGGRTRYLAAAGLEHRRTREDARLSRLARAAYAQGRAARRYDERKDTAPTLRAELRILAGCGWHTVRRRCAYGIVFGAHSTGRLREATRKRTPNTEGDDFASGTSGQVWGIRATTRAVIADVLDDAVAFATLQGPRVRRAAARAPRRRVLALAIERTDVPNLLAPARAELNRSHHDVELAVAPAGDRGKFANLNALLEDHPVADADWLLVVDDDVTLPAGFLDTFLFLAERFGLQIAQPAHRHRSHAAWQVTRRRRGVVARETAYVEIGPVCAFHRVTFETVLPFPPLRFGWGLDLHWSALARDHGWREGIIDATPIRHGLRRIAASYDRADAVAEARAFLATRAYTPAPEAQRTLARHRAWTP